MRKNKLRVQRGFTIIELVIAAAIGLIVTLGIAVILVDSQRGWQRMYNRIYSDVATDSYVARKTFDSVIRKASSETFLLDAAGSWIEVYYYGTRIPVSLAAMHVFPMTVLANWILSTAD